MEEERPFRDPKRAPSDADVVAALQRSAPFYRALADQTATFEKEWIHSKAGGWMAKVHDGQKALCYVVPLVGSFRVSLTVRPAEREALLADARVAELHERLRGAKRYAEGHALRFDVDDRATATVVRELLARIIELRAPVKQPRGSSRTKPKRA